MPGQSGHRTTCFLRTNPPPVTGLSGSLLSPGQRPCFQLAGSMCGGGRRAQADPKQVREEGARSSACWPGQEPKETLLRRKSQLHRGLGCGLAVRGGAAVFCGGLQPLLTLLSPWKPRGNAFHSSPCAALGDFSLALGGGGRAQDRASPLQREPPQGDLSLLALRLLPPARVVLCQSDHFHRLNPGHGEANLQRVVRLACRKDGTRSDSYYHH
ncbi:uncharacterized protein LOC123817343 [Phyllostomus hastatus]|uniref:uncharacterized protein LOC123817343 n=1 Tax=Phyllostomus hastatus TaxID=9423 RepID=UPI001E684C05|nr:uncharacterized protein LOC123817343 [Phyllostomus hastatus]